MGLCLIVISLKINALTHCQTKINAYLCNEERGKEFPKEKPSTAATVKGQRLKGDAASLQPLRLK